MVGRTHHIDGGLIVEFKRDGQPPESMVATDGEAAWVRAIALISRQQFLLAGDVLTVRLRDSAPAELPAFSRASHSS